MFILVSAITINHEIEHQLTSNYSVFLIFHNKSVCQNLQEYSWHYIWNFQSLKEVDWSFVEKKWEIFA